MAEKQNVVLIVMDTARYDAISPHITPKISDLASKGTSFENAFSCAPWTLPSHASLFTGTYPSRHKSSAQYRELDQDLVTMAEIFQNNGYYTKGFSNNVWINQSLGFAAGFDDFHHGWQYLQSDNDIAEAAINAEGWDKIMSVLGKMREGNIVKNLANLSYGLKQKFLTSPDDGAKKTTDEIITWLDDKSNNKPYFLFVNYLEPHLEYRPPKRYTSEFLPTDVNYEEAMEVPQNAWKFITKQTDISEEEFDILKGLYYGELKYLDMQIGRVIESIKDAGEWEDTILVITGDHGENIGHHGLMDHQYCLYDTLLHVPLIVQGKELKLNDDSTLVQLNDILPTLIDAIDLDTTNIDDQIQGISLYDNSENLRDYIFAEYRHPQPSKQVIEQRVGDPQNIMDEFNRSLTAVRNKESKLIIGSDGMKEAYDITKDPKEQNNVYSPSKYGRLEDILTEWGGQFSSDKKEESKEMADDTKERLEDLGYLQ